MSTGRVAKISDHGNTLPETNSLHLKMDGWKTFHLHMDVSKNRGKTTKMDGENKGFIMENPIKHGMIFGVPLFLETPISDHGISILRGPPLPNATTQETRLK